MKLFQTVSCCVFAVVLCVPGITEAGEKKVTLQNLVEFDEPGPVVGIRVVLVHIDTNKSVVHDLAAAQKKTIGNLPEGDWAVVITRIKDGKRQYVVGGIASVVFDHTLVAFFETGVDVANLMP